MKLFLYFSKNQNYERSLLSKSFQGGLILLDHSCLLNKADTKEKFSLCKKKLKWASRIYITLYLSFKRFYIYRMLILVSVNDFCLQNSSSLNMNIYPPSLFTGFFRATLLS